MVWVGLKNLGTWEILDGVTTLVDTWGYMGSGHRDRSDRLG